MHGHGHGSVEEFHVTFDPDVGRASHVGRAVRWFKGPLLGEPTKTPTTRWVGALSMVQHDASDEMKLGGEFGRPFSYKGGLDDQTA